MNTELEISIRDLGRLKETLSGELFFDSIMLALYATDASAYREMPLAVAIPANVEDIKLIIAFAAKHKTSVIPRTAGTSLAGQVVGKGIVVDISKNFRSILEINENERWARVQPGVVRDELNLALASCKLFFGPETSTSNRCMIGGMVGNNSCGNRSIIYGSTRDHLISVKALLSDGSETEFKSLTRDQFEEKCRGGGTVGAVETGIYQKIKEILSDEINKKEIRKEFPKPEIKRRNTGYAIDILLETEPFSDTKDKFNFCKLIAGSEGTLAFITEIKINLVPVLPPLIGLACLHFHTLNEALRSNLVALKYKPSACELIDHYVLECTRDNIEQRKNSFFVQGEPAAVLIVEFARESKEEIEKIIYDLQNELRQAELGYAYPVMYGDDVQKVWSLRKAGLGLLSNLPGDHMTVEVIEDTAVDVNDLPDYITEFGEILKKYGLYSIHYAHAGSGELHLRPIINLKTEDGNYLFRKIAEEIAVLVKKYRGSLSGEHGDGRLRGEFIRYMIGDHNYQLLKDIKATWDPDNIFNPGKITDAPPMNTSLRLNPEIKNREVLTVFNFDETLGIHRASEKCSGSGDCRKSHLIGGTMCPSYMVTKNEKDTTRARANILREMLNYSPKENPFDHQEILEVMDLCISCKGCKSECPSNVDMTKLKAEFLHQYYQSNRISLRTKLIANFSKLNSLAIHLPGLFNILTRSKIFSKIINRFLGFSTKRSFPKLYSTTLRSWYNKNRSSLFSGPSKGKVFLFCDEFTNCNDVETGIKAIKLLSSLGYEVELPYHLESGRTYLSKGLLKQAKNIAVKNIEYLKASAEQGPIIGIEPSAILTLRDEYLSLADPGQMVAAKKVAASSYLIDEFLALELDKGVITSSLFTKERKVIKLHGHCHQKALSSIDYTKRILSLPENYEVIIILSGCCGMAGSFGYEEEHYDISMKIGELVLFPEIRDCTGEIIIAAPGTSCRHQIKDGTGRKAHHPVDILWDALIKNKHPAANILTQTR